MNQIAHSIGTFNTAPVIIFRTGYAFRTGDAIRIGYLVMEKKNCIRGQKLYRFLKNFFIHFRDNEFS